MVASDICYESSLKYFYLYFNYWQCLSHTYKQRLQNLNSLVNAQNLPTVTAFNADDPPPSLKKALYPADQFSNRS